MSKCFSNTDFREIIKMAISHLDYDYDFIPPPDAPVFTPTMEEFKVSPRYFRLIPFSATFSPGLPRVFGENPAHPRAVRHLQNKTARRMATSLCSGR